MAGLLLGIVVLAAALRIPGIPHELPHLYTHDEVSTVETALRFGTGSLRPYSFGHGSLMPYLMAGFYGAYYGWLRLTGSVANPGEFVLAYLGDPTPFYLIHRGFTVALALGVVVLTFLVGRRLFGTRTGLIGALLVAFANVLFVLSLAAREDLLYLFLLMLGVYASLPIYEGTGTARSWAASGVFIGLAAAAKYLGVFGLLFPVLACLGRGRRVGWGLLWMAVGFVGGLLVGMPLAFLNARQFVGDVLKLAAATSGTTGGASAFDGLAYPTIHVMNSVGLPLQAAFVLGAIVLFLRERQAAVYLLIPPMLYLAALTTRSANQAHYYVAFSVPFLGVAAGWVVDRMIAFPARRQWPGWVLGGVLVAVLLWPNVAADFRYLGYLSMPDTRDVAKAWIERTLPPGSWVVIETRASDFAIRLGPPLRESVETLRRELSEIRRRGGSGKFWEYKIARALQDGAAPRYELLKVHTVRPEVLDGGQWQFVVASLTPDSAPESHRLLGQRATVLAVFPSSANFRGDLLAGMDELSALPSGGPPETPMRGPTVSVWKRRAARDVREG